MLPISEQIKNLETIIQQPNLSLENRQILAKEIKRLKAKLASNQQSYKATFKNSLMLPQLFFINVFTSIAVAKKQLTRAFW